jgi:aldehyde dehydrogenase (NAD+)
MCKGGGLKIENATSMRFTVNNRHNTQINHSSNMQSASKRLLSTAPATFAVKVPKLPDIRIPNTKAFINGEWVSNGKTFTTHNPATEKPLAEVTLCGQAEIDAAVDAATDAFYRGEWSKTRGYQRSILMNRLADLIEKNADEIAMLECLDNGKPFTEARFADINLVIQCYRYYAGWADKIHGQVIEASGPLTHDKLFTYLGKEPVGVVGQVIPWNFPALSKSHCSFVCCKLISRFV